jgi:dihydroneopterin aldolase
MLSIHLKNLSFHAYHGLYEEEKILGNTFIVNVHVNYLPPAKLVTEIEQALNYETLFGLVHRRMMQPSPLLETVVTELCHTIMDTFGEVSAVLVSLEKTNPPIKHLSGSVVVSFQLERSVNQ